MLILFALLLLGVVLVNGWTDAPNAVATCISTRACGARSAIWMAAVCNFAGLLVMMSLNRSVATTVYRMADLGNDPQRALTALCAAMLAIVIWALAAWFFGIPTSESHALVAGLSGAAVALRGELGALRGAAWGAVLGGILFCCAVALLLGFLCARATVSFFRQSSRSRTRPLFVWAQRLGAAAMAFMHGAQDGQKFVAVFLLGVGLSQGGQSTPETAPAWLMLLCCTVMATGTAIGGGRIIRAVGMDMVRLQPHQGFAADAAAALCLLVCSLCGMPVSTTHAKSVAILGVGTAANARRVNWRIAQNLALTWIFTFPACGLLGFAVTKLLLLFQ